MDRLEWHNTVYDTDGEPRMYLVPRGPRKPIQWADGDICVCGVQCRLHWNESGDWIGCAEAKIAEGRS